MEETHDLFASNFDSLLKKIYNRAELRFIMGRLSGYAIGIARIRLRAISSRGVFDIRCVWSFFGGNGWSRIGDGYRGQRW
jgi:hypothetical protein